jgi:hypothetical protein
LAGFAINYLRRSGLILVLSSWLENEAIRRGFVVMAAVPPAVAIIPLTELLGGDLRISLYDGTLSYGAALLLMPGIILVMAGKSGVGFWRAFKAALVTILLPLALYMFIGRRSGLDPILLYKPGLLNGDLRRGGPRIVPAYPGEPGRPGLGRRGQDLWVVSRHLHLGALLLVRSELYNCKLSKPIFNKKRNLCS